MSEWDCDEHKEDKDEIWACLSCYDQGVAMRERFRIIKVLEEAECQGEDDWCETIEQAIALIKGEK